MHNVSTVMVAWIEDLDGCYAVSQADSWNKD